jgi:hypothetical protein
MGENSKGAVMEASSNYRLIWRQIIAKWKLYALFNACTSVAYGLRRTKKTLPTGELRPKGDLGLRGDRSKPLDASL